MAAEVDVEARKWGDSIAVIIPRKVVDAERIAVKDRIHLMLQKEHDVSDLFGRFRTRKTPQQLKHDSRRGWQ